MIIGRRRDQRAWESGERRDLWKFDLIFWSLNSFEKLLGLLLAGYRTRLSRACLRGF